MSRKATWKLYVDAVSNEVIERLQRMPDKQLKALLRSLVRVPPTSSNCWCVSYTLAPIIQDLAQDVLRTRRWQRKRVAKAKTPFEKVSAMIVPDPEAPRVVFDLVARKEVIMVGNKLLTPTGERG